MTEESLPKVKILNVFYIKIPLRVASKASTGHYSLIQHLIGEASQSCVTVLHCMKS